MKCNLICQRTYLTGTDMGPRLCMSLWSLREVAATISNMSNPLVDFFNTRASLYDVFPGLPRSPLSIHDVAETLSELAND